MKKIILIVILAIGTVGYALRHQEGGAMLRVSFLDVGQGDAIYVRSPSGFDILIDGGPDNLVIEELGGVMPFNDRTIDLMILSHPDADHVTGLVEVFDRFNVKRVWYSRVEHETAIYTAWKERLADEGSHARFAEPGYSLKLDDGLVITMLYPTQESLENHESVNDTSVSVRLSYGENDVVLTGDLEIEGEKQLVATGQRIDAEILKAGHHGSKTSSTDELLDGVMPEYIVISVGEDNTFGHPSPEVTKRLRERDIDILRTDCQGMLTVLISKSAYQMEMEYIDKCAQKNP